MPRVHVVGHVQATLYAWTGCYYQLHNFKSEYLWDIAGTAGVLVLWGIFGFIRSTYTFLCYHRLLLIEYCIEQRGKLEVSAKFPFAVCACVLVCVCRLLPFDEVPPLLSVCCDLCFEPLATDAMTPGHENGGDRIAGQARAPGQS